MAELFDDTEKKKKDLYRLMLAEEATAESTRKYSFPKFKERLSGDKGLLDKVADIAVKKAWAANKDDFYGIYFPETIAPPAPKPQQAAPVASNLQQVSPVEPSAEIEEGEVYIPTPQPAVGSPEYDAQLQMQYGGMSPTLGATFGGVPASFETEKQKKQERISPVFKAQQLAFEDVPIAEEQRRAQREFAKATKEQQKAALRGGTGFEYEQEKKAKEREFGGFSKDFAKSQLAMAKQVGENILTATKNQILEFSNIGVSPMGEEEPEAQYYQREAATRSQEMYNAAAETEQKFRDELSKRNIKTSVYDAIQKGQWNRVPEAVAYTIGEAAIQMGAFYLTRGGSAYLQTLPQEYKDEVDAIAAETNRTPEQVIADGDDAPLIAKFSSGLQYAFEKLGMDQISKGIASRGGYKAVRDWMLKKSKSRALSRAAGLGFVAGTEALTEGTQTGVSQASTLSTSQKPFIAKVNKFFKDPELIRERKEAMTAGAIGGLALAGGGQAIQSAMDRTLFEAPVIGKTSKRPDASVVMTDDKLIQRNNLNKAMESAIQANPEAEGQIRERYRKLNDALELTDDEVVNAYDGIAQLPESKERDAIRERLEQYMAEKGIQPEATGMGAGLGELARQDRGVTPPAPQPPAENVSVEPITQEEEDEDLLALQEQLRGLVPQEGAETEAVAAEEVAPAETAPISPTEEPVTPQTREEIIKNNEKLRQEYRKQRAEKREERLAKKQQLIDSGLSEDEALKIVIKEVQDEEDAFEKSLPKVPELPRSEFEVNTEKNEADFKKMLQQTKAKRTNKAWGITNLGEEFGYEIGDKNGAIYIKPYEEEVDTEEGRENVVTGTAIELVYVPPTQRGRGKAKKLIQQVVDAADKTGTTLKIEAVPQGEEVSVAGLKKLYESFGFVFDDIYGTRSPKATPSDEVVSVAPVAPPAPKAKKAAHAPKQEKKEEAPAAPETKPKGKPSTPEIGSKATLPPQVKGGQPRTMVYTKDGWKQLVGGDELSVGEPLQKQAQEAFEGKPSEAKPTTETKGETKPTEFGKAMSASSRFNPKELVVFDTPIVGPNGNKLVAYQWAYEWTMKENKEGELVDKRISDWTQAESSAETGRDVVHKFTVEKTDGTTVTVSSETIPSLLGYTEAKQMKGLPSVVSAVKTLAKQRMRLAILEAQEAEFNALEEKFEKSEKPEVKEIEDPYAKQFGLNKKGEFTTYGMGDVWRRQDNKYNRDTDSFKKVPLSRETIKELEREWVKKRIEEAGGKYPSNISDLRNRVKRQEKKVEEATNSKITIKEQTAPSTPTTAPTPSLASQVEEMRTLPPAKRKAMQESLEAQNGKEEVAKMIEITANFTKIIDSLEEKGIVKKDCP